MSEKHRKLLDHFDKGYHVGTERIDGEIIEMVSHGYFHELVGRNIFRILDNYVSQNDLGEIFYYGMMYVIQSFPDDTWLVPDISYIKQANITHPISWRYKYPHIGVPDLAVEVVSISDDAHFINKKIWTWLEKDVLEVWLIYPHQEELHQYTNKDRSSVRIYGSNLAGKISHTIIEAEDLFPGIEGLTTDAIFKLPKWAMKDDEGVKS